MLFHQRKVPLLVLKSSRLPQAGGRLRVARREERGAGLRVRRPRPLSSRL